MAETHVTVSPDQVHQSLGKHLLVDGFEVVMDLEKSHGPFLYDSSRGRELLDLFSNFSTFPLGYNHPGIQNAEFKERILPAALSKTTNSDIYTTLMAEFVETFARTVPEPLNRHMFFIEGGALAVENALKVAFDWKVRRNLAAGKGEKGTQVIHFRESFHGRSGYTLSLTNTDPTKTQYFPKFDWPRILNPKLSFPVTDEVLERVIAQEKEAIAAIEQACADNPDDIAALIIEPIQGEGGDNYFRAEFLQELRRLADEHEFLYILDEVQTGFATTGKWWSFEHFDVVPDIIPFGKKTQVCGICVSDRIDDVDSVFKVPSRINSTWGGNLVDMVRCQRYVEVIEEENLMQNAAEVGQYFVDSLWGLAEDLGGKISNVRGLGLHVAFDLPDHDTRNHTIRAMREESVIGFASGTRAIRFRPALVLTKEHVDLAVASIGKALRNH